MVSRYCGGGSATENYGFEGEVRSDVLAEEKDIERAELDEDKTPEMRDVVPDEPLEEDPLEAAGEELAEAAEGTPEVDEEPGGGDERLEEAGETPADEVVVLEEDDEPEQPPDEDEAVDESPDDPVDEEEDGERIPSMEETEALDFEPLKAGDVVKGTIVQVNPDSVLVDVGYKTDGVIPRSEMKLKEDQVPADVFEVGKQVPVYVLSVDGRDGGVLVSYRRALEEVAWDRLYAARERNEILKAPVVEEVKGGLVLDVGVRGFMPASHVDRGYVNDLNQYVGETIRMRVIEIDRAKNRIILSRKAVLEEEYSQKRDETWATIEEGQKIKGTVKGITDFGAFVDLGGVDGLLHVSEMSWGRVGHPSDVVKVGDEIEVMVLRVDREEEKISLGLKQLLADPWSTVSEKYAPGSLIRGRVMRLAPFGAFVELEPGVEGLIHISQLADYHVNEPSEVVSEGEDITVKVLRVQPEERRISLSLKDARREQYQPRSERRTGLTLGDVFGDLLEETRERLNDEEDDR